MTLRVRTGSDWTPCWGEAKCLPSLAADGEHWDQDPWLLGVGNGVLDLRTGILRPRRPEDNITCFCDVVYDPAAVCPRWLTFLAEVFDGDADLIDFVWRVTGYALSGITIEQVSSSATAGARTARASSAPSCARADDLFRTDRAPWCSTHF